MSVKRATLASTLALTALVVAPVDAKVAHTVEPGETLWSIAARSNLTTRTLAAANGLPETASVMSGTTIQVPSVAEGAAALRGAGPASSSGGGAPPPAGAYTVRPGDTLTGIAARAGVAPGALAAMNGLGPSSPVIIGAVMKLPAGSPAAAAPSTASASPPVASGGGPQATPGRVTSAQIGQIASTHGVPSSLASAVAWQESGFNNGLVSSANARGVMQVLPGTWNWVERNVARRQLDPASAQDNVHAGSMYLGQLLRDSGGDPARAVAGYYQGEGSVRRIGMLPETQRYVNNVLALRGRFGGP
jgi:N-acetylmuramoyl-L-alanine amidase